MWGSRWAVGAPSSSLSLLSQRQSQLGVVQTPTHPTPPGWGLCKGVIFEDDALAFQREAKASQNGMYCDGQ